jgi:DNA polymerase III psi subunit
MDKSFLQYLFSEDIIYKIPAEAENKQDLKVPVVKVSEEIQPEKVQKTVAPPTPAPVASVPDFIPYNPKNQVLILVDNINQEEMELLGKILGAVQLQIDQVDLLDLSKVGDTSLKNILTQKSLRQLLTFGVSLFRIQLEIPLTPYQIREVQGVKFLYSDALGEIKDDVTRKKALWSAMKAFFA